MSASSILRSTVVLIVNAQAEHFGVRPVFTRSAAADVLAAHETGA